MILKIKVKPNSRKQEIEKIEGENYKISLKSKPKDNKANIELLKLLKKHFNVESKNIKIIKGLKSRNKIIEVK
ncbi:MAG: DUF167 domain-containing protein [Candidatus Nanoarchaeia archaeon]|nr:DUF167 domain-containing protein [Candidatus Nanoarchaeia archaeon]MDD5740824.1 DUF167 domain-containing protein [Candidatus Nanoarchaeia archaeon]